MLEKATAYAGDNPNARVYFIFLFLQVSILTNVSISSFPFSTFWDLDASSEAKNKILVNGDMMIKQVKSMLIHKLPLSTIETEFCE